MDQLRPVTCIHEGVVLKGLMAAPITTEPGPAVLVMHTALGLGPMRRQVSLLAQMGYVAIATDMYGDGAYYTNPADAGTALTRMRNDPQLLRARTVAWHAHVSVMANVDPARIGAIGYCFGGHCVLELARSGADVTKDPYAPEEHVQTLRHEMTAAEARWQLTVFGDAEHGFTDPDAGKMKRPGIAYLALADRISWAGATALLETELGAGTHRPQPQPQPQPQS